MLGSVHDAEDALQDASLRAWRGLGKFEGRSSLRSWLYTIATNTCLNQIARRPKRVLPIDYGPAADPHGGPGEPVVESVWVEPYPDETLGLEDGLASPDARYEQRESVELAFIAALQLLPAEPACRADPARGARVLGPGGRGLARHLRRLREQRPAARPQDRGGPPARAEPAGHAAGARRRRAERDRGPLRRGMGAERLRDRGRDAGRGRHVRDAAARHLVRRQEEIGIFLQGWPLSGSWRWRPIRATANGQPALAFYAWDDEEQAYLPFALNVLTFRGHLISDVVAFVARATEIPPPSPTGAGWTSPWTRPGCSRPSSASACPPDWRSPDRPRAGRHERPDMERCSTNTARRGDDLEDCRADTTNTRRQFMLADSKAFSGFAVARHRGGARLLPGHARAGGHRGGHGR